MVLCRTLQTAPEQGQGLTAIVPNCSGSGPSPCPGTRHSLCDYTINPAKPRNGHPATSERGALLALPFF